MGLLAMTDPVMDLDQYKDPWQFDTVYIFNPIYYILEQSVPIKSLSYYL